AVPGPPLMVPAEVVPSPHPMMAEKSLSVPVELASVNVAVAPANVAVMAPVGPAQPEASCASTIVAVLESDARLLALSMSAIVTLMRYVPSSAYVCEPLTLKVLPQ